MWTDSERPGCTLTPSFYSAAGLAEVPCKPQGHESDRLFPGKERRFSVHLQQEMDQLPGVWLMLS